MKITLLIFALLFSLSQSSFASGVAFEKSSPFTLLELQSNTVSVSVENQIAVVTSVHIFKNITGAPVQIKYGFPTNESASVTDLRWKIGDRTYRAVIGANADSSNNTDPGEDLPYAIRSYLGSTPTLYDIPQTIQTDSTITIELKYVEFLPYSFGTVFFEYPGDYTSISSLPINYSSLSFELRSQRLISEVSPKSSHSVKNAQTESYFASLTFEDYESPMQESFRIEYRLDQNDLGLFGFSTRLPNSTLPDEFGGFFTFIAEPDSRETSDILNKYFTIIIDRSGSMMGNKMNDAKEAAKFIISNLNEGDFFNIVDFSNNVTRFQNEHVPFTATYEEDALAYIASLSAGGGTNISGSFDVAVPQFAAASENTANIIIFLTDGEATFGITSTNGIVSHVNDLVTNTETNISLFTFGIGSSVNTQLLSLLASENNGLAAFLGNDQLVPVITQFYLKIQNPVLINTQLSFNSDEIIEVYPTTLPNIYKGEQLIISGRYMSSSSTDVTVSLSGNAFGQSVNYDFPLTLVDSTITQNQFLTKVWAKNKMESLLVEYNRYESSSNEAKGIRDQIINLSITYGVLSPFTRFSDSEEDDDGIGASNETFDEPTPGAHAIELLGNYPNPFNPSTTIKLKFNQQLHSRVFIRIYNTLGQLVKVLSIAPGSQGIVEVVWDGTTLSGAIAPTGLYLYVVDYGDGLLTGKMTLVK